MCRSQRPAARRTSWRRAGGAARARGGRAGGRARGPAAACCAGWPARATCLRPARVRVRCGGGALGSTEGQGSGRGSRARAGMHPARALELARKGPALVCAAHTCAPCDTVGLALPLGWRSCAAGMAHVSCNVGDGRG